MVSVGLLVVVGLCFLAVGAWAPGVGLLVAAGLIFYGLRRAGPPRDHDTYWRKSDDPFIPKKDK